MVKKLIYSDMRLEYSTRGLHRRDLNADPFLQFQNWLKSAVASGVIEPNAFFLATVAPSGQPSCRALLMKHFDSNGLLFFTNTLSRKADDLAATPLAAATFWWGNLERQIRLEGSVEPVGDDVAAAYFSHRPRQSQLGAWASHRQGEPLKSSQQLRDTFEDYAREFEGREIPLPPFWGGYRLIPTSFEFWQGSAARLHDRFLYTLKGKEWKITRLSP